MEDKVAQENRDILSEAIKDIKYGSVTAHIQDGKIVYIERTEKIKVRSSEGQR